MWNKIKQFFSEVIAEMKKVSWPSRQELIGSTVVVITLVAILSLYIGVVDAVINKVLALIYIRN